MKKIGVIGIGNPLRSDDGIGIVLIEKLIEHKEFFPENIDFLDGGTGGFNILHDLSKYEEVVFIDAVNINKKPGETMFLNIDDIRSKNQGFNLTTHCQDFLKIIDLSEKLKEKPSEIYLYAVQPKDLSHSRGVSQEVKGKLSIIFKDLKEKIDGL